MKRNTAVRFFALVLAFLGIVIASFSNTTVEKEQTTPVFKENYTWTPDRLVWTRNCALSLGDSVLLRITPPILWGYGPYDVSELFPSIPGYIGPKIVWVDFILNESLQTWFELWYYQEIRTGRPVVVNRSIYEGRNDCLIIEKEPPINLKEIGGIVRYSGNYTIRIAGPSPPVVIPPTEEAKSAPVFVELDKISIIKMKPYTHLLIPGLILIVSSVVLGVFSLRVERKAVSYRLRHTLSKYW